MQVRNNSEAPIMFQARTNAGKMLTMRDQFGNEITKAEHPKFELICIPASGTVEIKDKLWIQATSGTTEVRVFETQQEQIPDITQDGKPVFRNVEVDTGKTKKVNLVKERIKKGDLTIVVDVESTLTTKEKIAALAEKKIKVDLSTHTKEEIDGLHSTVCL